MRNVQSLFKKAGATPHEEGAIPSEEGAILEDAGAIHHQALGTEHEEGAESISKEQSAYRRATTAGATPEHEISPPGKGKVPLSALV